MESVRILKNVIQKVDAIQALDGFEQNDVTQSIDAAVLAGDISYSDAAEKLLDWLSKHKSISGFEIGE